VLFDIVLPEVSAIDMNIKVIVIIINEGGFYFELTKLKLLEWIYIIKMVVGVELESFVYYIVSVDRLIKLEFVDNIEFVDIKFK
jgi:hypothetical protein